MECQTSKLYQPQPFYYGFDSIAGLFEVFFLFKIWRDRLSNYQRCDFLNMRLLKFNFLIVISFLQFGCRPSQIVEFIMLVHSSAGLEVYTIKTCLVQCSE